MQVQDILESKPSCLFQYMKKVLCFWMGFLGAVANLFPMKPGGHYSIIHFALSLECVYGAFAWAEGNAENKLLKELFSIPDWVECFGCRVWAEEGGL